MSFEDFTNYWEGEPVEELLGIGTINECFHCDGSLPRRIERLNNLVNVGAIESAVCFNIVGEIPSGPLDFETSSDSSRWYTSCSVQSRDSLV